MELVPLSGVRPDTASDSGNLIRICRLQGIVSCCLLLIIPAKMHQLPSCTFGNFYIANKYLLTQMFGAVGVRFYNIYEKANVSIKDQVYFSQMKT